MARGDVIVGGRVGGCAGSSLVEGLQVAALHEVVARAARVIGQVQSELLGSTKTLGWLAPLSTAGQPSSVNQMGLDCGTQAVGVADSTPPGRLKCWFATRSDVLEAEHPGLAGAASVMGVRVWASRSAGLA